MPIYLDETRNDLAPLTDYNSGFGEYVGAKFGQALHEGPTGLMLKNMQVTEAETGLPMFDPSIDPMTGIRVGPAPEPRPVKRLDAVEARDRVKQSGVKLTVPDTGISEEALQILIENQQDRNARNLVIDRSASGARSVAGFGAAFAGSLLDPVNVASGFVPVVGQARYTALLAQAGGLAGRTAIRAGVGAAEGLVGAALLEPAMIGLNKQLQNDYSMTDSILNVAFGTVFGGGLHTVGGAAGEGWRGIRGQASPWERFKGLNTTQAMDVMRFESDLTSGRVADVQAATQGWTAQMRRAAGLGDDAALPDVTAPRSAGVETAQAPDAPFAKLYETTPEAARAQAIGDVRDQIRADLLAEAGNRAASGDIPALRAELADADARLAALDDAEFKSRAKQNQGKGMSRKEAESAARKAMDAERADLAATKDSLTQQIDTNAKASQAEQAIAALEQDVIPERFEPMVQKRIDEIMARADMARATLQMDRLPASFVIGMASPETRTIGLQTAVAHLAQGQMVNVEPVFHAEGGRATPDQIQSAAQRQQRPEADGISSPASSRQADERLQRSSRKQANLQEARKASDDAVEQLTQAIRNLESSGASPELVEKFRAEQKSQKLDGSSALLEDVSKIFKSFDDGVKDAEGLGRAVNAAAVCGLRN